MWSKQAGRLPAVPGRGIMRHMKSPVPFTPLLLIMLAWSTALPAGPYQPKSGGAGILTVGPGKAYALPSEAARAAKPGDIIRIFPGVYTDCALWEADGLA